MRLLQLKPQIRQNWTALAVARHLQGDLAGAVKVLAAFEDTLKVIHSSLSDSRLHRRETTKNILRLFCITTPY
jgi:hypothetical protein